jgi:hypothetical protein
LEERDREEMEGEASGKIRKAEGWMFEEVKGASRGVARWRWAYTPVR